MNELGRLVATTRAQRGYATQQAFADALGKQPTYVSRLERGAMKEVPTPEDLHAIADVLRLPEARLLEAAGYRVIEAHPHDGITLSGEDPRAEIVRLLADADDSVVLTLVATIRSLLPALTGTRSQGGKATA